MPKTPLLICFCLLLITAGASASTDAELPRELAKTCNTDAWALSPDGVHSRVLPAPQGKSWDLRQTATLKIEALRTDRSLGGLRLRWVLLSRTGGVYQATHAVPVSNAAPAKVGINLLPEAAALTPVGHQRPWDDFAAAEVLHIELRAECSFAAGGEALKVALSRTSVQARQPAVAVTPELVGLRVLRGEGERAELLFRLQPMPADPFADEGAGDVRVHTPEGAVALAYLDQEFVPRDDGSALAAMPVGAPFFRAALKTLPARGAVKIASGAHTWTVDAAVLRSLAETPKATALENSERIQGRWMPALTEKIPAEAPHGLLRVCSTLKGDRFEAVVKNVPTDVCWRPVPFWTAEWGGFSDTIQPNLELAARMDAALRLAAQKGEVRPLLLFDGTTLGRTGAFNWLSHPARGISTGPGELYRNEQGMRFLRRWMRYSLARWGHSGAVNELWIGLESLAPGDAAFFSGLAKSLQGWSGVNSLPVFALHPFAAEDGAVRVVAAFEGKDNGNWFADARQGQAVGAYVHSGSDGGHAYELRARKASDLAIGLTADLQRISITWNQPAADSFSAGDTLLFDLLVPADAPPDLRAGVHLRDRDGLWYQTMLPGMPHPGDWVTLALDLSGRNMHGLEPVDHAKPWTGYSRQRLPEIGIHLYSTHATWPQPLRGRIDNVRLAKRPSTPPSPVEISVLKRRVMRKGVEVAAPAVGDLLECDVAVNRVYENPFDPTQCDLSATLVLPSGKKVSVPLFFNQPCVRSEATPGGDEIVLPQGGEFFTLRYRLIEAGPHRVTIELRDGGRYDIQRQWKADNRFTPDGRAQAPVGRARWGQTNYPERFEKGKRAVDTVRFIPGAVSASLVLEAFTAAAEKGFKGFVRTAADKRHFEFDDGSFYYALGPCVRSPSDTRIAYLSEKWSPDEIERLGRRGTYQYDDYFTAYEKAGINWARVWMCPWWCALEWRRDWPGYQGVGRYNLLNAWRLDHVLDEAEKRGIYISLCLTNHGQYSLHVDSEWVNNPYSAKLGGPLIAASEFFSRGDAKILHQNKLRYIAARYGHSPAVASWALFSELEWTEEYEPSLRWEEPDAAAPILDSWHTEMANFLREHDPNRHLVLTHFSHPTHGESTLALPAIDVAASNAYSAFQEFGPGRFDAGFALASYWAGYENLRGMAHLKKPVLVEEQGRHWMGGRNNTERDLRADLHAQLWGGMAQPLAGATGYWWWVQLHIDNRYDEYAALARFLKGEDFRPAKGETVLEPAYRAIPTPDGELHGRALKSNRRLYAWVYHPTTPRGGEPPPMRNGDIRVGGLDPGEYKLEFWDTQRGEILEERAITIANEGGKGQSLNFKLPPVKKDMALKLKPK